MIKHTLLLVSLFASLSLAAQRMEISGGVNFNTYYDNGGSGGHYSSEYTSHTGYAIRLGVDEVMSRSWEFRFTLGYERYGGGLSAGDGGNGGGYYTKAEVEKSLLSFGFYPVNFKLDDNLDISIGIEGSRLLNEAVEGTYTNWTFGGPDKVTDLQDKYDRYSAPYCVGLQGRIGYEFRLSDRMMLVPQLTYYYGLSPEFEQSPETAKSSRLFLGIGLTWDLTPAGSSIPQ